MDTAGAQRARWAKGIATGMVCRRARAAQVWVRTKTGPAIAYRARVGLSVGGNRHEGSRKLREKRRWIYTRHWDPALVPRCLIAASSELAGLGSELRE
jgi:hypothetical protein